MTGNPELAVAPMLNNAAVLSRSAGCAKVIVWIVRIVNDWMTGVAAAYVMPPAKPPACAPSIVHIPGVIKVTAPALVTVHTLDVLVLNVNGNPDVVVPPTENTGSEIFLSLSTVNEMVWSLRDTNDRVTLVAAA